MTITIERGTESTAPESEFNGTVNLRRIHVDEALADIADAELGRALKGSAWEAQRFGRMLGGNLPVSEAFSTSDFKLAVFKELDTEALRQYNELPSVWSQYCDTTLVSDFRHKRILSRSGSITGLARVPEATEYPDGHDYSAEGYAITVGKYGRRRALTWEAWINNEAIDEIEDIPTDLARQARETESILAVSNLLALSGDGINTPYTASGVKTDFFKSANGNAPTALPLTYDNLKTVLDSMATKKNKGGRVIAAPSLIVVIPKALEAQMLSILAIREIRRTANSVETLEVSALANVSYVVEPMLDILNTHAKAATTWFVVPKPGGPKPALWTAKLRSHEQPDLRVKADQGSRVGGGAIAYDEGSFEIDTIEWRVRHVFGAQNGDPTFTYVSLGS